MNVLSAQCKISDENLRRPRHCFPRGFEVFRFITPRARARALSVYTRPRARAFFCFVRALRAFLLVSGKESGSLLARPPR